MGIGVPKFTGLSVPDAERRVDTRTADSKKAISRTRASAVILAFSVATALGGRGLSWAGAAAGGRHRDSMPLPNWMVSCKWLPSEKEDGNAVETGRPTT